MKKVYAALSLMVCAVMAVWYVLSMPKDSQGVGIIYANSEIGSDTTGDGSIDNPYKTFHKAYVYTPYQGTIHLTGTFDWTDPDEIGDQIDIGYEIRNNITITADSNNPAIVQAASAPGIADRAVFKIWSDNTIINNLIIRHGVRNVSYGGAGIMVIGTATINSSSIQYNEFQTGEEYTGYAAGGIYVSANSVLHLNNSEVAYNSYEAFARGAAGIFFYGNSNGVITGRITNSTISHNTAVTSYVLDTVDNKNSFANVAGGIGITNKKAEIDITNTTIAHNSTNLYGGGLFVFAPNNVNLTNVTIAHNSAGMDAGGFLYQGNILDQKTLHIKNSIIADNSTSGTTNDFYIAPYNGTSISTVVDSGYNIVESAKNFADLTVSSTFFGEQEDLNLSDTLADNFTQRYTKTLALRSGSIAIDAGNASDNASDTAYVIAIPNSDQRGGGRNGIPDIGAYEYQATGIDEFYTITFDAGSYGSVTGTLSQSIAPGADGVAVTAIPDAGYTFIDWNDENTDNPRVPVNVQANTSYTAQFADITGPTSSIIIVTPASSSIRLAWQTNEAASNWVNYGVSNQLGNSTSAYYVENPTTTHDVIIDNLQQCTTYFFQLQLHDEVGNVATSSLSQAATTSCPADVDIVTSTTSFVPRSTRATIRLTRLTGNGAQIDVPAAFSANAASFQVKKIPVTALTVAGKPVGKETISSVLFQFDAYTTSSNRITRFDEAVTVTLEYTADDIDGMDETSLIIHRWDGDAWYPLTNCFINTADKTVSCDTISFSLFGIFGEHEEEEQQQGESPDSGAGGIIADIRPVIVTAPYISDGCILFDVKTVQAVMVSTYPDFRDGEWIYVQPDVQAVELPEYSSQWYVKFKSGVGNESAVYMVDETGAEHILVPPDAEIPTEDDVTIIGDTENQKADIFEIPKTETSDLYQKEKESMGDIKDTVKETPLTSKDDCEVLLPRVLQYGDVGDDVRALQVWLNDNGYILTKNGPGSPGNETRFFGEKTVSAVRLWQKMRKITPATGILNEESRMYICIPSDQYFFAVPLSIGSYGDDVQALQTFLNSKGYIVSIEGSGSPGNETLWFYQKTAAALKAFQEDHGLPPFGYFGPKTRAVVNR